MSTNIDELSIQISASTFEATKNIGKLVSGLKHLQDALSQINVSDINGVSSALGSVSESLKDISNSDASKTVSNVSKSLSNVNQSANVIGNMAKSMNEFSEASSSATDGYGKLEKTLESVTDSADKLKSIAEEFATINKPIEDAIASSKQFQNSIRNLRIKLSTDPIEETEKMLDEVKTKYEELRRTMANSLANASATGVVDDDAFKKDKEELEALRNEYLQVMLIKNKLSLEGNKQGGLSQNDVYSGIVKSLAIYKQSLSSVLSAMGKFTLSFAGIPWAVNLTKKAIDKVKDSLESLRKKFTRIWKMLTLMVTRKILQAVIKNGLEGIKNMIRYSDELNASVSLLWNSMRQLGNSVGAAIAPLINAFAPAIDVVIQKVIEAINWFNQLFSALNGSTTWTKATKLADDYAQSLEDAASNGKKANKQLQSFDALNNLTTQKNGSTNIADMFETKDVPNKFQDLANRIRQMLKTGDFYDLGSDLGQALKNMLDNIPWAEIKEKARKLGKALASLINGFINVSGLGYSIGKTLAEALNTAFEFLNAFVHELDWEALGKFIADTLNGLFEGIDWDLVYDTFVTGFDGMATAINSFIDNFHWNNLSTAASNIVNTLSDSIYTFFKKVKWEKLGSKLGNEIRKTILKINWKNLGRTIGVIIQSAINFFKSLIGELSMKDIVNALGDFFGGVFEEVNFWDIAKVGMALLGVAILKAIPTVISQVLMANALKQIIMSALGTASTSAVTSLLNIVKPLAGIASVVTEFLMVKDGLYDLVKGCDNVGDAFKQISVGVGVAVTACTLAFGIPAGAVIALIGGVVGAIAGINKAFDEIQSEKATTALRNVLKNDDGRPISDVMEEIATNIRSVADGMDGVITAGSKIPQTDKDIENTITKISGIQSAMDQAVIGTEEAVAQLKDAFNDLATSASEKFGEVQETLISAFASGGTISVAFGQLGVDVGALQGELTGITQATQTRINELNEEIQKLLETDPSSSRLAELQQELYTLIGTSDEATEAISDYQKELKNIDYSGYVKSDKIELDTTTFLKDIESVTTAMQDAYANIDGAFDAVRTSLETELNAAKQLGDTVKTQELEKALSSLDAAMGSVKESVTKQGTDVANAIQTEYVDKISDVLDDAKKRWEEMSWFEQLFTGAVDADDYASREAQKYIENVINPMAEEIEKAFSDIGIDGEGWADETAKGIMEDISLYVQDYGYILSDSYRDTISEALESVTKTTKKEAEKLGKASKDGIVEGMKDTSEIKKASSTMAKDGLDEYAKAQDSASPSKEYAKLSLYSIQGLVKGFEDNKKLLLEAVKTLASETLGAFKEVSSEDAWTNAMEGIVPAFENCMKNAIKAMKVIWNDFADTFNEMAQFEIPEQEYNGQKISSSQTLKLGSLPKFSTGGFPENGLFMANSTEMVGKFSNGKNAVANNEQIVDGIAQGVASANSEQNMLLRQQNSLLQAILEKETGISSDALFRSVQNSANSYYKRTGRYAFN